MRILLALCLQDENGNWHVGAIATLVDTFGSLTAFSFTSRDHTTVDFTISHYSTAKVQVHFSSSSRGFNVNAKFEEIFNNESKLKSIFLYPKAETHCLDNTCI